MATLTRSYRSQRYIALQGCEAPSRPCQNVREADVGVKRYISFSSKEPA